MCQRKQCLACAQLDGRPLPDCAHDRLERHESPAIECEDSGRTPTKPMPVPLVGTIDVDIVDTEAAAEFLELVARVIREKKRLRITIE